MLDVFRWGLFRCEAFFGEGPIKVMWLLRCGASIAVYVLFRFGTLIGLGHAEV